jgi:hypothetical protein
MNRFVLAALMILALAAPARANAGPPSYGGQPAGEPAGMTRVAIAREHLVIDLRPLAHDGQTSRFGRVSVEATYQLDNQGAAQHLDLVFASGANELVEFLVTLDGQPVASQLVSGATLPDSWKAPTSTPLPDGGDLGFTLRNAYGTAGFTLDVPPGRHVLAISYLAEAMTHHVGEPTVRHQFAYVLSPARAWAGFGGLDVTVHTPPGWIAALTPAMTRTGDTFKASYDSLRADSIALTVYAPLGAYRIVQTAGWILFALLTLGGGPLVRRAARGIALRRAHDDKITLRSPFPPAGGLSAIWAAAVLAAGGFALFGADLALPAGQADHRGLGDAFFFMTIVFLSLVVLVLGIWIGVRASRGAEAQSEI